MYCILLLFLEDSEIRTVVIPPGGGGGCTKRNVFLSAKMSSRTSVLGPPQLRYYFFVQVRIYAKLRDEIAGQTTEKKKKKEINHN